MFVVRAGTFEGRVGDVVLFQFVKIKNGVDYLSHIRSKYGKAKRRDTKWRGNGICGLSDFAMCELGFRRVLFLIYRNQLAKQGMKAYRKVFAGSRSMGMVSTNYHEYKKDFISATVQSFNKEETLRRFHTNDFDAIKYDDYVIIGPGQKASIR